MTVQSAAAPFPHIPRKPQHGTGSRPAAKALAGLARFFRDLARANEAANLFQSLLQLSDADLARRGLARGALSAHVFEQTFGKVAADRS